MGSDAGRRGPARVGVDVEIERRQAVKGCVPAGHKACDGEAQAAFKAGDQGGTLVEHPAGAGSFEGEEGP